ALMWKKLTLTVVNMTSRQPKPRSSQEWDALRQAEQCKEMRKTIKVLSQCLTDYFAANSATLAEGEVLDTCVAEALACWRRGEGGVAGMKKEVLAQALAALHVRDEAAKEAEALQQWAEDVSLVVSKATCSAGVLQRAEGYADNGRSLVPSVSDITSQHWEALRCASLATWAVLSSFAGLPCSVSGAEVTGVENFRDSLRGKVAVSNKKLTLKAKEGEMEELLKLRMCFAGRLVPVSRFFTDLGFDTYIVPVARQLSADLAIKSPLFSPAWLVRASQKKKANMDFEQITMLLTVGDKTKIDVELPTLVLTSDAIAYAQEHIGTAKVAHPDEQIEVNFSSLLRPLSGEEELVAEERSEILMKKREARQAARERDEKGSDAEEGEDKQVQLSSAFLRHVLK
ncbi:unnamed protein product, partial [Effrenium voratum]